MLAYKAFNKDMTCTKGAGIYQFKKGRTEREQEANCAHNGFHCAENPLDCLDYYPDVKKSVYYQVEAAGDIDEDGNDSKISCTELTPVKQLSLQQLLYYAMVYMLKYPARKIHGRVERENGTTGNKGYSITRGVQPLVRAKGGDVIAIMVEDPDDHNVILDASVKRIPDGEKECVYTLINHRIVPVTEAAG